MNIGSEKLPTAAGASLECRRLSFTSNSLLTACAISFKIIYFNLKDTQVNLLISLIFHKFIKKTKKNNKVSGVSCDIWSQWATNQVWTFASWIAICIKHHPLQWACMPFRVLHKSMNYPLYSSNFHYPNLPKKHYFMSTADKSAYGRSTTHVNFRLDCISSLTTFSLLSCLDQLCKNYGGCQFHSLIKCYYLLKTFVWKLGIKTYLCLDKIGSRSKSSWHQT